MYSTFLDKQFIKEFRDVCLQLKGQNSFNIQGIPIPEKYQKPDTYKKLTVRGLKDLYLQPLNEAQVDWLQERTIDQNIYWNSGEIKRQERFSVPAGAQLVRTTQNLEVTATHKYADELVTYVDYKDEDNKRYFYYTLPDTNLYENQATALVIAQRIKPNHLGGVRLVSTKGYTFFLFIVPVKHYKNIDSQRILATQSGVEYTEAIQELQTYWLEQQFTFDPLSLDVIEPIDATGATNLVHHILEPTLEYEGEAGESLADKTAQRYML